MPHVTTNNPQLQAMHSTQTAIYDAYLEHEAKQPERQHLGASKIGRECARELWYDFRWAKARAEMLTGQKVRLFHTGHREEARMAKDLRRIPGVELHTHVGDQRIASYILGGHFGGECDGIIRGVPESPKDWHVWENKTHNLASFKDVSTKGVAKANPEHVHQGNTYAGLNKLDKVYYTAECKDDDSIYVERFAFSKVMFDKDVEKARKIITSDVPPPRRWMDPTWYYCRSFCDYSDICHGQHLPRVTCRSCTHSTAKVDGEGGWHCNRYQTQLPYEGQVTGCRDHRYIPILLENSATVKNADDKQNWVQYQLKDGSGTFVNGPTPGLSSAEIRSVKDKRLLADPAIESIKMDFPNATLKGL